MRSKIILVNGGIVLVLCLVAFFLIRATLAESISNPNERRTELERSLNGTLARFRLDSLVTERWLAQAASSEKARSVFEAGTAVARSEAATAQANVFREEAAANADFAGMSPSLVLFVDADGVGIGRNGSELMRGDQVAKAYPSLLATLKSGESASALWVNEQRQEQLLASYAPVRGMNGSIVGQLVLGTPLNDGLLSRTGDMTGGTPLAVFAGSTLHPIAVGGTRLPSFDSTQIREAVTSARQGAMTHVSSALDGHFIAAVPMSGFAGRPAVLVGSIPRSKVKNVDRILWPVLFVAVLGLLLVAAGATMLGNYISKPIAELEEGLLLVANGESDLRFDLEHDVLGGLTTRLNELLNSVQGTSETDRTD